MTPSMRSRICTFNALLFTLILSSICCKSKALVKKDLWLECSCMYANERNESNWGSIAVNSSTLRGAKNDCYLIFITGGSDELAAFRLKTLQLAAGFISKATFFRNNIPIRKGEIPILDGSVTLITSLTAADLSKILKFQYQYNILHPPTIIKMHSL